jgi:hypothetical protein
VHKREEQICDINFSIFLSLSLSLTRCRLCLLVPAQAVAAATKRRREEGGADEAPSRNGKNYYSEIASYIKFNLYDQQPLLHHSSYYLKYHMRVHFSSRSPRVNGEEDDARKVGRNRLLPLSSLLQIPLAVCAV